MSYGAGGDDGDRRPCWAPEWLSYEPADVPSQGLPALWRARHPGEEPAGRALAVTDDGLPPGGALSWWVMDDRGEGWLPALPAQREALENHMTHFVNTSVPRWGDGTWQTCTVDWAAMELVNDVTLRRRRFTHSFEGEEPSIMKAGRVRNLRNFLHVPRQLEILATVRISDTFVHAARGSIVDFAGDIIVNAANEACLGGGGVDGAITRAGGPELAAARRALPTTAPRVRCPVGEAVVTKAQGGSFGSLKAHTVIHAVGPDLEYQSKSLLGQAYRAALRKGTVVGGPTRSIAFPIISGGVFRGDFTLLQVILEGLDAIGDWIRTASLRETSLCYDNVVIVGFTDEEAELLRNIIAAG